MFFNRTKKLNELRLLKAQIEADQKEFNRISNERFTHMPEEAILDQIERAGDLVALNDEIAQLESR